MTPSARHTHPDTLLVMRLIPADYLYTFRGVWWDLLGERQQFDAVIHAVILQNPSSATVTVSSVSIEGSDTAGLIQHTVFLPPEIEQQAAPVVARDRLGLRPILHLILGTTGAVEPETMLSANTALAPGQALLLPNLYLTFPRRPDALKVTACCTAGQREGRCEAHLTVREYDSAVRYRFPLDGVWLMKGTPDSGPLDHHRFGWTNEFGIDLLQLGPGAALHQHDGTQASDYYSFGAPVLAAADGRVVAAHHTERQEWTRFNPRPGETVEQGQQRQLADVQQALRGDIAHWAAGNVVILQHAPAEYSAYLHLREDSLRVVVGEDVRQGQPIADVGNTGDSFGAHLHFQVMDRPDLLTGRSLPFVFTDTDVTLSEPGWLIQRAAR